MKSLKAVTLDGKILEIDAQITKNENSINLRVSKADVPSNIDYIDLQFMAEAGKEGDNGYMVLPNNQIFYFKNDSDDCLFDCKNMMPVWGVKKDDLCYVAIVKSMNYDFRTIAERKNGVYYVYPRFLLDGDGMPEDIIIDYTFFNDADADYNNMAAAYREYILENRICIPLKERAKDRDALEYAIYSPLIRIRNAWKPCPSPVLEQTLETEPPMHIACDFDRVGKIIDELKKQGVDSAEVSLVGWNLKGHDGRWPDALPAEPALGGNEKLKAVIKKGKENGFNMTCHTNSTDAYSISSRWDKEKLIRKKDMSIADSGFAWSGGFMYHLCSTPALEFAKEILPEIAELGFHGIHYIDVMSSVHPQKCYHPEHSLTRKGVIENYRKIAELATELFGGFSSESASDYACPWLDYVLYADGPHKVEGFNTKEIPFWELVYHGIVLYNPFTDGINYTIKSKETRLKFVEFGGRPSFYFHSRFLDETSGVMNWMGLTDLLTDDAHIEESVKCIKEGFDEYKNLSYLQKEFMVCHKEVAENVYCVTYSDGSKITVDYNKGEYKLSKNGDA